MDVVTTSPSTPTPTSPPGTLRLRLADSASRDASDGAWWPRTRDLQTEVADLVDHFPESVGRVSRLLFSRPDWDGPPTVGHRVRSIVTARGRVQVTSFPSDDPQLLLVTIAFGRRLRLVVIPSESTPVDGERILAGAGQLEVPTGDGTEWDRWDGQTPWG